MILLDTDVLTLLFQGHERVVDRMQSSEDDVTTSVITWIEVLQGRFAAILKAAGTEQLIQAQDRLQQTIESFASLPIVPIDRAGAEQFDKLLRSKKLKKLGRGDLLIASIALSRRATLVTRNARDFRQVSGLVVEDWS